MSPNEKSSSAPVNLKKFSCLTIDSSFANKVIKVLSANDVASIVFVSLLDELI